MTLVWNRVLNTGKGFQGMGTMQGFPGGERRRRASTSVHRADSVDVGTCPANE